MSLSLPAPGRGRRPVRVPPEATGARLRVLALRASATTAMLICGHLRLPCAIGRSGVRAIKREGDGASPLGRWPLRRLHYRPDRWLRPATGLPVRPIRRQDGWCDAACDHNYNRPVRLPYPASAEEMWRADALYDAVIVLGHNERPRGRYLGSAIFMHLARPGLQPTAGCVALSRPGMARLLARLTPSSTIEIGAPPPRPLRRTP